jgi:hypothetical protein
MIVAITAHLGIGLGALLCQTCGKKICRHRILRLAVIGGLMVAEASASVLIIDKVLGA